MTHTAAAPNRPVVTAADRAEADAVYASHLRCNSYGAGETNPLSAEDIAARNAIKGGPETPLSHPDLVKITRIRLVGFGDWDFPGCELSYCYGEMRDGTPVRVDLGQFRFTKRTWKSELIQCFKDAGKFGKRMGVDVNDPCGVVSRI